MKWKDLSLKERKQIYDSVRANNPDATYFDIKEQFDSIPAYEDGKDNFVAAVYSLPEVNVYPQNRFGDIARSQGYETAKNWQAVKNATTAGINGFANDPRTQFVLAALPIPSGVEGLSGVMNIMKPASKSKQLFYHGSPVRFDKFDAQFIGSAEGGSKAMKGINLWHNSPKNAPKFANIKSPDAPIHLGRSSKPLGGELNPTVYNVIGSDLNLYKTESNRVKSLLQSNLEALKYDGIQTPSQTTVFPGSINKLKIVKKQSIPDFIRSHPEVDKWTQWTTNEELRNLVESNIPAYEDGKNRSRWLTDKAYRDSICTLQNSQRFKISKEFKSPTLEELRNDSSVGGNIGNSDGLFTVLDGLEALKATPSITSEQIENATDSQYNSRINRLEPLKQYAKVGSIIGQAALGGGAIVARNAGNAALSSVLQGAGALWDGVEAIQAVNDGDFKSVIQNVVPIGAAGVASLKYAPKFKYTNNLVIDAAENIGPIWDLSVNPIIEFTKDGKAPAYEDGGKNKNVPVLPKELGLTPGTPEYLERQKRISGSANVVQPEAYITPAGYIKDAVNFIEDLGKGDYTGAAIPVPSYKNGGIHIKKSKRGTFKAAAKKAGMGVQEYANKVLKKGSKASPAMKKKAVFARNSAKWNH